MPNLQNSLVIRALLWILLMLCTLYSAVHITELCELSAKVKSHLAHKLLQTENHPCSDLSGLGASCLILRLSLCKMECQHCWWWENIQRFWKGGYKIPASVWWPDVDRWPVPQRVHKVAVRGDVFTAFLRSLFFSAHCYAGRNIGALQGSKALSQGIFCLMQATVTLQVVTPWLTSAVPECKQLFHPSSDLSLEINWGRKMCEIKDRSSPDVISALRSERVLLCLPTW